MRKWKILLCMMGLALLAACGTKQANLPHDGGDLAAKLGQGYVQKVDTALFMLDASSTMFDGYEGVQKFSTAQNLLLRMNSAIAGLRLESGLIVFGPSTGPNLQDSNLVYGMKAHSAAEFTKAVMATKIGGLTPLAKPLTGAIDILQNSKGRIAVILVSDGMDTNTKDPIKAAAELKRAYGDRICIYTVLIGNDPKGRATMEGIAKASDCGFATTAATLSSGTELASFLEKVFLEKRVVKAAPAPMPIPMQERIVLRGINFDFDKAIIKPEFMPVLDVARDILKERPDLKVVVEGHTCNIGTDAYNQKLSERRAKAVYEYLVKKGVNAGNLSTVGLGETQPMADNKTESGRQLNRRVEFKLAQ